MKIGYARVSTQSQCLDMQIDALEKAGCEKIFLEKASGSRRERPELREALHLCKEGDTLVVYKLDRLARSLKQLLETIEDLESRSIAFLSLTESIDTSSSVGRLIFHLIASLAEFERSIIRDRVLDGIEAAKLRGKSAGRPRSVNQTKLDMGKSLLKNGEFTVDEICDKLGISVPTLYNYIPGGRGAVQDGVI